MSIFGKFGYRVDATDVCITLIHSRIIHMGIKDSVVRKTWQNGTIISCQSFKKPLVVLCTH